MKSLHLVTTQYILLMTMQQLLLQQQVAELQSKIIDLQAHMNAKTPKTPPDEEVFWHISSGGMLSTEAANSDDLATLRKFRDWNIEFAQKHIQPYVSPVVFSECVNQMTRGLAERIAELETEKAVKSTQSKEADETSPPAPGRIIQLALIH